MSSLTLDQQRAIDRCKERLVVAAEELLEEAQVLRISPKHFGHSQLRNLIAVAMETDSPAVVLNFLRYQMGRDAKNPKNWALRQGGIQLGQRFIDAIHAGVVYQAVAEVPELEDGSLEKQLAHITLTRHFLGFASRYLKFLDLQREADNGEDNP